MAILAPYRVPSIHPLGVELSSVATKHLVVKHTLLIEINLSLERLHDVTNPISADEFLFVMYVEYSSMTYYVITCPAF